MLFAWFAYWRDFTSRCPTVRCHTPEDVGGKCDVASPPEAADLAIPVQNVPPMQG
jgi:hypothetical protein